jgi:uncharacterized glyoxalase superfamily protein PhnB
MPSTIVPTLRYRDARRMIEWLGTAFGFAPHAVYEDGEGGVAHAQLTLGEGMVMLAQARGEDGLGPLQATPGGMTQGGAYVVVQDADAAHAQAEAAGAEILVPLQDQDHGGRGFSCRDPEGHLWHLGTHDPWLAQPSA